MIDTIALKKLDVLEKIVLITKDDSVVAVNVKDVERTRHPADNIIIYQGAYYMFDNGRYRYFARVRRFLGRGEYEK